MHLSEHFLSLLDSRAGQYWLACGIALCIPVLRGALNKLLFEPAGRRIFEENLQRSLSAEELELRLRKWKEASWKAFFRIVVVTVGLTVCMREGYFTDTRQFWEGCTSFPPCNFPVIPRGLRFLITLELGFYLDAVPFLFFVEVRRHDFLENLVHHLVTICLIVYSSQLNLLQVGSMIILCHEINDIFLEAAKMGRYSGHELVPTILFVAFVVSWVLTRLVYFPAFVIWNIYTEPPKLAEKYGANISPHWEMFLALLSVLLVLHIYWSVLIIKIVFDKLTGNAPLDDIREAPAAPPVRGASAKMNGLPDAYHAVEEQKKGL